MSEKPSGRGTGPGTQPVRRAEAPRGRDGRVGRGRLVRHTGNLLALTLWVACLVAYQTWEPAPAVPEAPDVSASVPPVELPLEVNARVVKWMRRYVTDEKQTFQTFLAREGRFSGLIRAKLRARGMPEDLLYLAMIESGFSPKATSTVSAAGVWQFMRPTAAQFGLRLDHWVDERRDPVRVTDAALDYLQWLHRRYGSWYLAAAAYNAGPSRVDRALRRHGGEQSGDADLYWDILEHLPRETREYVPRILAAAALARNAEQYGFHVKPAAPFEYDRVWVPGGTALAAVAKVLKLEPSVMRELNPHLVRGITPPGAAYGLRVPQGTTSLVVAALGNRPRTIMAD